MEVDINIESVNQFAQSLEQRNKGFKSVVTPMITEVLAGVVPSSSGVLSPGVISSSNFVSGDVNSGLKVYYFGVLTVGNNVDHADLYLGVNKFIQINKNSQIVDYFSDVKYLDVNNVAVSSPEGHFRGYQIDLVSTDR